MADRPPGHGGGPLPAVSSGLEVAEFEDELVVLDLTRQRVHHLRVPASVVFDACRSRTAVGELRDLFVETTGLTGSEATALIDATLVSLSEANLVDPTA